MPGPEFFQTGMGHKFYDSDVPRIVKALERIAAALEKLAEPKPPSLAEANLQHSIATRPWEKK